MGQPLTIRKLIFSGAEVCPAESVAVICALYLPGLSALPFTRPENFVD